MTEIFYPLPDRTPYFLTLGPSDEADFNPGLLEINGKLLLAWRAGNPGSRIFIGELAKNWAVCNRQRVAIPAIFGDPQEEMQDPRLFLFRNAIWLAYTHVVRSTRRSYQGLVRLSPDGDVAEHRIFGTPAELPAQALEKNWQFFVRGEDLFAVYSIYPEHQVLQIQGDRAVLVASTQTAVRWNWGQPRGSTPPVLINGRWHSFFHSHLKSEKWWRIYHAGMYTFAEFPPFRVTNFSRTPCLSAEEGPWEEHPLVVFPGGAVYNNGRWIMAFGWHDLRCAVVCFDHSTLLSGCDLVAASAQR